MVDNTPIQHPFDGSVAEEVPLTNPPLTTVLFQVRFPEPLTALGRQATIDQLSSLLGDDYPYHQRQPVLEVVIQPGQSPQQKESNDTTHVFHDATRNWTLSILSDSFSLSTNAYESRTDFLKRSRHVFDCISQVISPPSFSRVGLRYVNRVSGSDLIDRITPHLVDEARMILELRQGGGGGEVVRALTQILHKAENGTDHIQCTWGLLPESRAHDGTVRSAPTPTWVLDIDAFNESTQEFASEALEANLRDLAERAYLVFRWAIKYDGLKEFGAE